MRILVPAAILAAAHVGRVGAGPVPPRGGVVSYPDHIPVKAGEFIVEFHDDAADSPARRLRGMPSVSVDHYYDSPFVGMAVTVGGSVSPSHLAGIAGVKRVFPNRVHMLSYLPGDQNLTSTYLHEATGVQRAREELGLDGKGVKIGIIDTGVDYMHPELGACWKTPGCPWQYGQDFVGDNFSFYDPNPVIKPNPTPVDCVGHGTHVSGILAAQGPLVQGVAPGATFGMYRVFACPDQRGSIPTTDAIVVKAMEAAYKDGHDIITMSLGAGGWAESPMSACAASLAARGVVVVAGNGNQGVNGLITSNAPAVGDGVIAVGSVDNWSFTGIVIVITTLQDRFDMPTQPSSQSNSPFVFAGDTPIVAAKDSNGDTNVCSPVAASLAGRIALIPTGNCTYAQKAMLAQQAGAVGVLLYNAEGEAMVGVAVPKNVTIPVALVTYEDGVRIAKAIALGPATVSTPNNNATTVAYPLGGKMSLFSSFGPTPELGLSPAISAPGGNIWSTYPRTKGSYISMSGTSMATPYLAGTAALLKQARPGLSASEIRELLVTTAKPRADAMSGLAVNPFQSGGGLVNIYDAARSRALIDPPLLPINSTQSGRAACPPGLKLPAGARFDVRSIRVTNTDAKRGLRVSLSNLPSNSLTMYDANGTYSSALAAGKPMRSWPADRTPVAGNTLPQILPAVASQYIRAGKSSLFTVAIIAPYGLPEAEHWFYGGFLSFALQWDGEAATSSQTVPYTGFNGDYSKLDVIGSAPLSSPQFLDESQNPLTDIAGLTITLTRNVTLAVTLALPTRILSATLVDAGGKALGYIGGGYTEYVARSQYTKPYIAMTVARSVYLDKELKLPADAPAGTYRVRVDALRPFGDPGKASDFQSWVSGLFAIA